MFLSSGWNTNFHLLSKLKRKPVGLSVFHDKGIGLSFLVLGGKSGNQGQGQVSGCLMSAAAPSFPPAYSCKCPHLQGRQKSVLELLASTDCLNCSSLFSWGKKTWAKEVGDADLRHEPEWAKGPLDNFLMEIKSPLYPLKTPITDKDPQQHWNNPNYSSIARCREWKRTTNKKKN